MTKAVENPFLRDILAQPAALTLTLDYVLTSQRRPLDAAGEMLSTADRIVLTSMGSAYHSLEPMAAVLTRWHPNVHLVETATLLRDDPHVDHTSYVVMSRSGESREIAELSRRLRERDAPVVAITMTPDSTLARNSRVVVHDPAPFDALICTKAYTSLVLTGLLLTSHLDGGLSSDLTTALHTVFRRMADEAESLLARIETLPWLGDATTFLSRGVGVCTAAAGALWLSEAARTATVHSSIDAFLHGPIEQVDNGFTGVWIDLEPDETGKAHRDAFAAKGARLLSVVTEGGYAADIKVPGGDLPPEYRTIPAAVPIQLVAYAASRQHGLEPGDLRYVDWVVR